MPVTVSLLGDRVLLKPDAPEETLLSGIVLADPKKNSEYPLQATVVGLPDPDGSMGFANPSSFLKIGDRVLFNPYAGDEVKEGDDEYRIVLLEDIYGLVSSPT